MEDLRALPDSYPQLELGFNRMDTCCLLLLAALRSRADGTEAKPSVVVGVTSPWRGS